MNDRISGPKLSVMLYCIDLIAMIAMENDKNILINCAA